MADPLPICYLNGEFQPLREARISPLDRGFLFADSVYEVLPVFKGRMFRFREHFDRLARNLREIRIPSPHTHEEWLTLLNQLIERNGGVEMYVYVQVTRGMEFGRNHAFPEVAVKPSVFAMAAPMPSFTPELRASGLRAVTVEDFRWGRCDIKTTALLANVLMKQQAAEAEAHEAIIVRNGEVLEGASSSLFAVIDGVICTPPNSRSILPGTTRDAALEIAEGERVTIRRITVDELARASEVLISAATRDVVPITRIDGKPVGDGKPGPVWRRISGAFEALRTRLAGTPAM